MASTNRLVSDILQSHTCSYKYEIGINQRHSTHVIFKVTFKTYLVFSLSLKHISTRKTGVRIHFRLQT